MNTDNERETMTQICTGSSELISLQDTSPQSKDYFSPQPFSLSL